MIEVLESLAYKSTTDLSVSVTANNVLPAESQTTNNGRVVYKDVFTPKFLEGAVNYTLSSYVSAEQLIRDYIDLKSSYNPIELQADYLKNTVYPTLSTLTIPFFNYWYDQVTVYNLTNVKQEIGVKDLYRDFGNSVAALTLFTRTPESTPATALTNTSIKTYNRVVESLLSPDLLTEVDSAYNAVNQPYVDNVAGIAGSDNPSSSHGSRLIADINTNSYYTNISAAYLTLLFGVYQQLMYLAPAYAYTTDTASLSVAPFFTTTVQGQSVVVDKLGNKVSTDQGWVEQVMLSSYTEE